MGPTRRARSLLAACVVAASALGVATSSSGATTAPGSHYLLALGDSLAAGYQPTDGTSPPPTDRATGYPDKGYPGGYAADLAAERHLDLVDLACPGETTSSMTGNPAIGECARTYRGELGASSQLRAAETFLARHRGAVSLVTLDIGANDIDGCVSAGGFDLACLQRGQSAVTTQLPAIVSALRTAIAADDPSARLVAMNYYDPFLGVAYEPGGLAGAAGAALSVVATETFDGHLAAIYRRAGVAMANVAAAFRTGGTLPVLTYAGHRLPLDVDYVCRWTWMCPLPGSPAKANIHADTVGYRVIARAFARVLAAG